MKEFKRKETIKITLVAIICLIGIIGVVSYTYSFFQIEAENSTVIKGEAATASLTVNVNKIAPAEETEKGLIPQLSDYITSAVVGRQGSCIDDNGNEVCQVYEVYVKNTSTTTVNVDGEVDLTAGSNSNLKWAQISHAVTTQNQIKPTLLSEVNSYRYKTLVTNKQLISNEEAYYYIVVWLAEVGEIQRDNGDFTGVVRFMTHEEQKVYAKIDNSGANAPGYAENLIPVMHNGTTWVTADTTSSTTTYGWYDYDAKKWANAVLLTESKRNSLTKDTNGNYTPGQTIGDSEAEGVLAFYVWIPRYKYKVWNINKVVGTDSYSAYTKGIDILFESGTETTGTITCNYDFTVIEGNGLSETCIGNNGDYYTHPAFKFGNDNLEGLWVGKFELSSSTPNADYGGGESTMLTARVLPNVNSWRYNTITNFWKVIKEMQETSNNIYGLSTNTAKVDTHLLTNMEWGAVAYLTHSQYGRCTGGDSSTCTETAINSYYSGSGVTQIIMTGCGLQVEGSKGAGSICNDYTSALGLMASTTGNIYGIYDMNGGSWEYVMGNMSSVSGSYKHYTRSDESNYIYSGNEQYLITYANGTSYADQTAYNRGRLGDATSEVVLTAFYCGGWYSDYSRFPQLSYSWFMRSGSYIGGDNAGVFYFSRSDDNHYSSGSTRASLVVFDND